MKINYLLGTTIASLMLAAGPSAYSHEQKMNQTDTDLARKIRQDLAADTALSAYAQNIKIIALDGKVILKGKVNSDGERQSILAKVKDEPGVNNVVSKLDVKDDIEE